MKYSIKNILVPTDFSPCANNALRVAIGIAKRHMAQIHLIHAYSVYVATYRDPTISNFVDTTAILLDNINLNLKAHKTEIIKKANMDIAIHAELGTVPTVVNSYVKKHNIDIIVMGTHGTSGFKEFFAGTNTYNVIQTAVCPVISVPLSFEGTGFKSILFPLRAVEGVVEKYDYIKTILDKNDSVIHLLGVAYEGDVSERYMINNDFEKVIKLIQHDERYMSHEAILSTNIADTILKVANKRNDDLIVINATIEKKWYQYFKGNYTQKIINHATIPIMAIKPELTPAEIEVVKKYHAEAAIYYTPLTI